jgi:hypothetical protein
MRAEVFNYKKRQSYKYTENFNTGSAKVANLHRIETSFERCTFCDGMLKPGSMLMISFLSPVKCLTVEDSTGMLEPITDFNGNC